MKAITTAKLTWKRTIKLTFVLTAWCNFEPRRQYSSSSRKGLKRRRLPFVYDRALHKHEQASLVYYVGMYALPTYPKLPCLKKQEIFILLRVIKETTCALLFWGGEKKKFIVKNCEIPKIKISDLEIREIKLPYLILI